MRMVGSAELESATSCVSSRRSNRLSYEPKIMRESGDDRPTYRATSEFPERSLPCQSIRPANSPSLRRLIDSSHSNFICANFGRLLESGNDRPVSRAP